MASPSKAGLFLYAKDQSRLVAFYEAVLGMRALHSSSDIAVLASPDIQLVVHQIPAHIAAQIVIASPPIRREDTALKFFFTVPSLSDARVHANSLGGDVGHENWQGAGFVVCNATDPEGNIFQVRESTP